MSQEQKKIADEFAAEYGINAVYCEGCKGWFCQCPHCQSIICCYHKMCCYACYKTYQPILDERMENESQAGNS